MKFDGNRTGAGVVGRPTHAVHVPVAVIAWALMYPVAAGIVERFDAFDLTGLRYLGGSLIVLALLWVVKRRRATPHEVHHEPLPALWPANAPTVREAFAAPVSGASPSRASRQPT